MRKFGFLWTMLVVLAFQVGPVSHAQADVVGRLTQVEGRVDLMRGGPLPATPVKVDDGVQPGDVLRTKSLSKAQITFIDNSIITLSPESRLAVDEYRFDPAQQKRNAVLNLFQGMAHVLVNKIIKEEPDFVIKTHTAVTGVRGTDFGIRLQPNASTILNFQGITQVANIFPEVGQLDRRAFKAAFTFGPANSPNSVTLGPMQGTTVSRGLPPTLAFSITPQDQKQFFNQMSFGVLGRQKEQGAASPATAADYDEQQSGKSMGRLSGRYAVDFEDFPSGATGTGSGTTSPSVPIIAPTGLISGNSQGGVWGIYTPKMVKPPKVVSQVQAPPPAPVQAPPDKRR
jgi:hypothetical protein